MRRRGQEVVVRNSFVVFFFHLLNSEVKFKMAMAGYGKAGRLIAVIGDQVYP